MVEELKLAIKVDDDAIEQSLLKQFANAEKMANKVVLTFNNIDLDDKAIEAKFKEMQKMAGKNPIDLSIDKSSIEMLSAISKQLGNIFDIAKGKSIIDSSATVSEINKITQATKELNKAQTGSENIQSKSFTTKNKTEAYNQLKQTADTFKQFYGNEEAMHTKAGTEAAYAYYKAYEEALKKGVAESKLQRVTVDVNPTDSFFTADRISSTRIKEFADFEKYGEETTALSEEISYFEKRLLKFSEAYSQIQSKLGKAPITPEIIQNIEEYVRNLEIAEARTKDADLMGFTKEDIDLYRDSANMYLGFATEDAIRENEKYISSLKEVKEEKENVDVSLSKSQISDIDSSLVEQQNKIQEELKETQKQAEQTSESLSNIGDGNKSNISSGTQIKDVFQGDKIEQATTSAKELDKTLEQVDIPTDSFDEVLSKLDLAESKLKEIVKITKQSVSDSEGKFHDSYTLKDKRGSTEIYGLSSNTEKGQLLRSNIVGYDVKEIEKEAKAIQKLAEEKRKLRQQEKQSTQSSVDKALKDQVSAWKQIQSIREKIAKSNDANEIENLKKVKKEYQQSYIEADKILKTNSDLYDKEAQIARLEQVRLETNKKIADYKNPDISSMESSLARFEESSEKLSLKPDNEHSFESWKLKIDELNNAINEYRNKITELQNKDGIIDKEDISEATELENRIKSLLREMQKTSSGDKGFEDISATKIAEQIHKLLEDNTAMSRKAKAEIQAYYDEVASGNPSRPLKEIYNDALKVVQAERAMGREGKSFLDTMKDKAWYGWAAQITSMFGVYDIINIFKQGANTLKEFDDGLTKISYTMDMTKSQLNDLGKSVLDTANDIDSSIDNAMQVSQIYANMNTSAEEIKKLSEPTLILSNLTGFDASTVADDIQAVTQQFEIAAEESMHIADVYDQISRNISVDYSKGIESIAEAVQVSGSTAKQAGLSFEQLAAIVGKTAEKTRLEGSQIGNGLKTIMTRLSKVGELSDEVDPETLSDASESLHKIGIEVYNADGSFRKFDVIMGELANKWDTLSDAEKSNISFSIAATRQTNLLSSILSNFSDSMSMAEEATNANGNALENNQKWVDSFGGHLQSLENTAKSAWINILDSETIKGGVDVLNSLLKVVVGLVDTFGLLPTAAGIGGIVAGFKNIGREKCYPSYRICL